MYCLSHIVRLFVIYLKFRLNTVSCILSGNSLPRVYFAYVCYPVFCYCNKYLRIINLQIEKSYFGPPSWRFGSDLVGLLLWASGANPGKNIWPSKTFHLTGIKREGNEETGS